MVLAFAKSAVPIKYDGSVPESGSAISSFTFTLKFDLSESIADAGAGDYGIGYTAAQTQATLYKVNGEEKIELGTSLTERYTGTSENFQINNDKVEFSFDSTIPIIEGQLYQVEITNIFGLYKSGKNVPVTGTKLSFSGDPLILTYYGGASTSDNLSIIDVSLNNSEPQQSIKDFTIKFNEPISIINENGAYIEENGNVISNAKILVNENDESSIVATFPIPIILYSGHTYNLGITSSAISLRSNESVLSPEYKWSVVGSQKVEVPILSSLPACESTGIFNNLEIKFDIPEGYTLATIGNKAYKCSGLLYKKDVSEDNFILSYFGSISTDGRSQIFDISGNAWEPSTKYIFVKPKDDITVWKEGQTCPEFGNEEYIISWTTPSAEELGLSPISKNNFGTAKVGQHDKAESPEFIEGGTYSSIDMLEIEKLSYVYNSASYQTHVRDNAKAQIYDITDGSRILVKDITIADQRRESRYDYYSVAQLWVQTAFYQGHEYEIVIPKDAFMVATQQLKNFVGSDEISFKVKGSTPTSVELLSKSIEDDSEISELTSMLWIFDGNFTLKDGATALYKRNYPGNPITTSEYALSSMQSSGQTYVLATFISPYTGKPQNYSSEMECSVVLPEGTIFYAGDATVCNKEVVTNFKGTKKMSTEPEFVNTTVTLADNETNEAHSFIVKSVKGYPAEIQMLPGENWNVADVAHEGKSLSAVNGVYTSEPLTGDSKIVATLAFNKDMQFDQTTGVYSVTDTNIKVYTENNQIVVSGLTQPTNIAVYSVGGILVKQMTTDAKYDMVRISAEPNEIYVVVINGQAAKVRL